MNIHSVSDPEFKRRGQIAKGLSEAGEAISEAPAKTPLPLKKQISQNY